MFPYETVHGWTDGQIDQLLPVVRAQADRDALCALSRQLNVAPRFHLVSSVSHYSNFQSNNACTAFPICYF